MVRLVYGYEKIERGRFSERIKCVFEGECVRKGYILTCVFLEKKCG